MRGHLTPSGISVQRSCRGENIKFSNVINCERTGDEYLVTYVKGGYVRRRLMHLAEAAGAEEDLLGGGSGGGVAAKLLARSYPSGKPSKPILVLINPHSGQGAAKRAYDRLSAPIFAAAGVETKVVVTSFAGEAREIVQRVEQNAHDYIVCVSGDGLIHEVINGLHSRRDGALKHFALAQLPGGTGNALCATAHGGTLSWERATLGVIKGSPESYDLMACRNIGGPVFALSFLSTSFGIVADCDLGTEGFRWLGPLRFQAWIVVKCLMAAEYPCRVEYLPAESDSFVEVQKPHLSMFYAGKLPFMAGDAKVFPLAEPADGCMDLLIWDTKEVGVLSSLARLLEFEKGTHVPHVPFYKKVRAFRLYPKNKSDLLSIDGEAYPCNDIEVSILPEAVHFIIPPW